jgi:hypothetical protein
MTGTGATDIRWTRRGASVALTAAGLALGFVPGDTLPHGGAAPALGAFVPTPPVDCALPAATAGVVGEDFLPSPSAGVGPGTPFRLDGRRDARASRRSAARHPHAPREPLWRLAPKHGPPPADDPRS